ncbi:hypothetical protein WISP_05257 [Willisornis vidua]|uniref:Uncharacterized protein n=1 Tax=Willisornis vidua TaxID=1566151 RepID=A0ABQ9DTS6_9PASS|nr:hypothetical protein WISP_05257 [Willisornis vidua]
MRWTDYETNEFLLEQAGITSIEVMLIRTQLHWTGHMSRMEDHRLLKIVLYGELSTSCHKEGDPKRRYKDSLKQYLSLGHIDYHQWSTLASDGETQRHTIYSTASSFENAHRISLDEKRQCRKIYLSPLSPRETFSCVFCTRTCLFHIGIFSHQHACSKSG